ncbi:MAG: phosphate/phosphite/phosphonate ABC transporter substrate-binding protein [Clostridia bacterium]|nr:phosphate/phosphite/phosphonate ABC transporter substrate-binding protein [Clostridia bacterium]
MFRKRGNGLVPIVLLMIAIIGLTGCTSTSPSYEKISLSTVEKPEVKPNRAPEAAPLRVAVASVTSAKESIKYYDELLNYLGKKLNRPVIVVQRKTYAEINDLMRAGNVDLAFVCSYAYISGRDEFGMELLAAPKMDGSLAYQSYLLVPKDSKATSWQDLRGKRFAFTDPLSTTGRIYPLYMLSQMQETPEAYFSKIIYTYSHDNSIKAVAEGLVDGATVDSLVYHYLSLTEPEHTRQVKIIEKSPVYGVPPVVVRPDLDIRTKKQLLEFFLNLHQDPEGAKILPKLMVERFVVPADKDYDSIRMMAGLVMPNEQKR